MSEIFDMEKKKWYKVKRNLVGKLVLERQSSKGVVRCLINGDFVFVDGKVERFVLLEPKTPPHCFQSDKQQETEGKK